MFQQKINRGLRSGAGATCRMAFGRSHHGGPWGGKGGGPWGGKHFGRHFGEFGEPGGKHRFGRGDLKVVILDLVKDQPRHGYDVIRALEERFHGFYSPSPGSVYPILQLLEDQGYVTSGEVDGKRVYTVTDAGRAFLAERAETVDGLRARVAEGWGPIANPEMRELIHELRQLGQFVFRQGARGGLGDADRVRRLREVVARARAEIEEVFGAETVVKF